MAAAAPVRNVDTLGFRYFSTDPPSEVVDDGAHCFGEASGVDAAEYKRRRHLVTSPYDVTIHDAREVEGGLASFKLDTHGFTVIETPEGVNFEDPAAVKEVYYPRILEQVKQYTGATHAFMTQHLVRTENPANLTLAYARFAHCDAGPDNVPFWRDLLVRRGVPADEAMTCDIVMFNYWHPWGRPAYKDPLCLLDFSSVNYSLLKPDGGDLVKFKYQGNKQMKDRDGNPMYGKRNPVASSSSAEEQAKQPPGRAGQGKALGVGPVFSPAHRWVYIPDQRPEEAWLFKQYDTRTPKANWAKCSFHNSFHDPFHDDKPKDTHGRRSVELRGLLTFPKEKSGSSSSGAPAKL